MSTPPVLLPFSHIAPNRTASNPWVPVLLSLVFICFTSTSFMGGSHTQVLVDDVWRAFLGKWHWDITGTVNEVIRKVGHFFGYGMVGLSFRNAWHGSIRTHVLAMTGRWSAMRWMVPASALSVASTFVVASLDEWHQRFVPGRVGSFRDVLLDTAGALLLNLVFWGLRAHRNRRAAGAWRTARG
jgi:VanZ family protein